MKLYKCKVCANLDPETQECEVLIHKIPNCWAFMSERRKIQVLINIANYANAEHMFRTNLRNASAYAESVGELEYFKSLMEEKQWKRMYVKAGRLGESSRGD